MNKFFKSISIVILRLLNTHKIFFIVLFSSAILSHISFVFYQNYNQQSLDKRIFQSEIQQRLLRAEDMLANLKTSITSNPKEDLFRNPNLYAQNIFCFVYKKDSLVFWSENKLSVPVCKSDLKIEGNLVYLPNYICLAKIAHHKNYFLITLIPIKSTFNAKNEFLETGFEKGFNLSANVQIRKGIPGDKFAIYSSENEYLFSLFPSESEPNRNEFFLIFSIIFGITTTILLLHFVNSAEIWIYRKEKTSLRYFCISSVTLIALILFCFTVDFPSALYSLDFFSPFYYASGNLIPSLGHFFVVSIFIFIEILFFYNYCNFSILKTYAERKKVRFFAILQIVSILFLIGIYSMLKNLIYHSSFSLIFTNVDNLSIHTLIALLIPLLWFASFVILRVSLQRCISIPIKKLLLVELAITALLFIFCPTEDTQLLVPLWYFIFCSTINLLLRKNEHISVYFIFICVGLYSIFVSYFAVNHTDKKNNNKLMVWAETIDINELLNRNIFAEISFIDLSKDLNNDKTLYELSNKKDSADIAIKKYLSQNYFRGFWDNYDINYFLVNSKKISDEALLKSQKLDALVLASEQIKNSHFYFCAPNSSAIDYIGKIDLNDEYLYIQFQAKKHIKNYSYPEQLLFSKRENEIEKNYSIASYKKGKKQSQKGLFSFPTDSKWIPKSAEKSFSFNAFNHHHFVYKPDNNSFLVISNHQTTGASNYLFFWIYLFVFYILITLIIAIFFWIKNRKENSFTVGFVSKIQISFFGLLLLMSTIISILFSIYLIQNYTHQHQTELFEKSNYIQKYIQESFKNLNSLSEISLNDLNFYLQEVANTYETDLHFYNSNGFLVASTQPTLFSKNLESNYIAPNILARKRKILTQTEHISKLEYSASYIKIFNKRDRLIGYVEIPSFFKYDAMQHEIFNMIAISIHIYLLFMIFVAILSFIISKQLSRPLLLLQEKLRSFRLNEQNSKLDYTKKDEIGCLVEQYNQMVDMLNESAEKLAKTEREMAWRQMARQVAHEIKNPLTPMKLTVQQLQRMQKNQGENVEQFEAYFQKSSQMLIEQIDSLSKIATAFSDFAKMPEAKQTRVDVIERLDTVVNLFVNNPEGVKVESSLPEKESMFIFADKEQLSQIFNNLIKNAIQAIPYGKEGAVMVTAKATEDKLLTISITDNGSGISKDVQEHLFTPNFTTKSSGMGIGLSLVKQFVKNNNGRIWFKTEETVGTTFFVEFSLI